MYRSFIIAILSVLTVATAAHAREVKSFPLTNVRLLESPFSRAQEINRRYLLELDADRLLAPYLIEAGLEPRAEKYTNWENTGLDGHIGGHYLSALSYMYASTGDAGIKKRLDYFVSELKRAQDANGNGYLGGIPGGEAIWQEIARGDIRASGFGLNGKWVPLYNIHKIFAGLRDAFLMGESGVSLSMLQKLTDWMAGVVENLTDEQMQDMLRSEHGGLNEVFADVYRLTGDPKYIELAVKFSHRAILDPLLENRDELTGKHANTQIPKVLGYKRITELADNNCCDWHGASQFFWETVTGERSVAIGGNSAFEHFHPVDDFSTMVSSEQGPETCNTYNMLRLSSMHHRTSPHSRYMDYYERALYNHILSSQHPATGGLVYFTPMRPGHYRVYSQPHTSMWCCVGSGIESHSKYGEEIYSYDSRALWVNLFIPSVVEWKTKGVTLTQENDFPREAGTRLTVNMQEACEFDLRVRRPAWAEGFTVAINGVPFKEVAVTDPGNGYINLRRLWKDGDVVEVGLPMSVGFERMPDGSDFVAVTYGPIVLAAMTDSEEMTGLFADDSRGGHIAHGPKIPLQKLPYISVGEGVPTVSRVSDQLIFTMPTSQGNATLIPFYEVHESRYIIYWPTFASDYGADDELDARTIDIVYCGQQQSETDHGFKQESSEAGYSYDRHWRITGGWYSYEFDNKNLKGSMVYVTFLDEDDSWPFKVEAEGEKLLAGDAIRDGKWMTFMYFLPDHITALEKFRLTISAEDGTQARPVSVVRLCSFP